MAAKDEDFASFCLECVRGPWKQRAEEAYERFRAAMPMKTIMERLLDETVLMAKPSINTLATRDDGRRTAMRFHAAARRDGNGDAAPTQRASLAFDRLRRVTTDLPPPDGGAADADATMLGQLVHDFTTAVTHLRSVARLAEQRVTAAAGLIDEASDLIRPASRLRRPHAAGGDDAFGK